MNALRIERDGHLVIITLDRPPVNAVDTACHYEIAEAFRSIDDDKEVRVAIFTAAGTKAFMAGADLRTAGKRDIVGETRATRITDPARGVRDAMWSITDCSVPVIGAINGVALGAGLAYAACCDILIASKNATFGTTEINVGLLGASAHLCTMVGRHKAREMFFTGEVASADEMYRLGVLRAVVEPDQLMVEARKLADILASKSPIAMRLAKESMARVEHLPLKEAYRTEQEYTARLIGYEDSAEARAAFMEKRDPIWKWR